MPAQLAMAEVMIKARRLANAPQARCLPKALLAEGISRSQDAAIAGAAAAHAIFPGWPENVSRSAVYLVQPRRGRMG